MHHHHYLAVPTAGLGLFAILPWPIALPMYLIAAVVALVFWHKGLEAMRLPAATGTEALPGKAGYVVAPGQARIGGETWLVESDRSLEAGGQVRVVAVRGLRLKVEPISSYPSPESALACPACRRPASAAWAHCPYCGAELV